MLAEVSREPARPGLAGIHLGGRTESVDGHDVRSRASPAGTTLSARPALPNCGASITRSRRQRITNFCATASASCTGLQRLEAEQAAVLG